MQGYSCHYLVTRRELHSKSAAILKLGGTASTALNTVDEWFNREELRQWLNIDGSANGRRTVACQDLLPSFVINAWPLQVSL